MNRSTTPLFLIPVIYFLIFNPLCSSAQDDPTLLFKGIIRDAATGEPIPYASISLAVNNISTISNAEGHFIFKIPVENARDSVIISHVGYQTQVTRMEGETDTARMITLRQAPVQLPDITVHPTDAWTLIQQAIDKIPDNYPTRPFVLTGFYRMDAVNDKKLVDLSEAVFTIYSPDNQRSNLQFRLIRARSDRDLTAYNGMDYAFGRSPDAIMDRDMISRIHQTQILGDEGHLDHVFTYRGLINYEGRAAYEIHFDQRDDITRPLYKGRIIIDTASLAFLSFDYGISPKGLRYRGIGKIPWRNVITSSHLVILYRRYGSKYYLNHVTTTTKVHIYNEEKPPVDFDTTTVTLNYFVTRTDTGFVAYARMGKKIDRDKTIERQVHENAGMKEDNFWLHYNLIEADYNVDSALAVIRNKNAGKKRK